jgi:hypothetical protein
VKIVATFLMCCWIAAAQIPPAYNTGHPRLPYPDNAWLLALAANSTAMGYYDTSASTWDAVNPASSKQFRRLLIAYLANKAAGNTATAAADLVKIKDMANNGGQWGQLYFQASDAVGNGTTTVTSASAHFTTDCGGSCAGKYVAVDGVPYTVNTVNSNTSIVINQNAISGYPLPSGSSLHIAVTNGYSPHREEMLIAIAYDWIYADLDATTRSRFQKQIEARLLFWENVYVNSNQSPYQDPLWVALDTPGIIAALTIYPDFDTNFPTTGVCPATPCGTYHLNWFIDKWFNGILPVWKQIMSTDGGGWHEAWDGYVGNAGSSSTAMGGWIVPSLLAWQVATGDAIFTREPWLKNFSYFSMYTTRPDYTMEHIGDVSAGFLREEYDIYSSFASVGVPWGSLNGLAEIYNDPVLRWWARLVNKENPAGPSGFEPSAWPFYSPDTTAKPTQDRSVLPKCRLFQGWGVLICRSGWGEDDTFVTFKYGDKFFNHPQFDTGSFTISHRGNLALDSGTYRAGSTSKHAVGYAKQTIAHNTMTVIDTADVYSTQRYITNYGDTDQSCVVAGNDGGQIRWGSGFQSSYNNSTCTTLSSVFGSAGGPPYNLADWRTFYGNTSAALKNSDLLQYQETPAYTYAAIQMKYAYNNATSASSPNVGYRTNRVADAVRHFLWIPRGTDGYVIVFDAIQSTNSAFVKKNLIHSVNQATITSNKFVIDRTELVEALPYTGAYWTQPFAPQLTHGTGTPLWKYQFNGRLTGWMVYPTGTLTNVGGTGKQFWIEDPLNPGTGTNWDECEIGQCVTDWSFLAPNDPRKIEPVNTYAPVEPGSWRIEQQPTSAATQDYFLNVMLATDAGSSNVPSTVTSASCGSGKHGATWSDSSHTYTICMSDAGAGGTLTIDSNSYDLATGGTAIPVNTMVFQATHGNQVQYTGYEKQVYAENIRRHVIFSNVDTATPDCNQGWVAYDFGAHSWSILDMSDNMNTEHMPACGHPVDLMSYVPTLGAIFSVGGIGSTLHEKDGAVWWYDTLGQTGRDKMTVTNPSNTQEGSAAFDSFSNKWVVWAGSGGILGTHLYDPNTNKYVLQTPAHTPNTNRGFASLTYDSINHKTYMFGGADGFASNYVNEVWAWDTVAADWTQKSPTGTPPSARWKAAWVHDSLNDIYIMFGGESGSGVLTDMWKYDPNASSGEGSWAQLTPTISGNGGVLPSNSAVAWRASYDSDNNVIVFVLDATGGSAPYADGAATTPNAAQTWLYRYAAPTGVPAPNAGALVRTVSPSSGSLNHAATGFAAQSALATTGSDVYIGWQEFGTPFQSTPGIYEHPYARKYNGSTFSSLPSTPVYNSIDTVSGNDGAHDATFTMVGSTPHMGFLALVGASYSRVYASSYNGTAWSTPVVSVKCDPLGGHGDSSLHQNRPTFIDIGGTLHAAFYEAVASLWYGFGCVESFNGSTWSVVGGGSPSTNVGTAGAVTKSIAIATDGTSAFVAFAQGTNLVSTSGAGTPLQVIPRGVISGSWATLGSGSLNADATNGWAQDVATVIVGTNMYICWTERGTTTPGTTVGDQPAQLRCKKSSSLGTGATWSLMGSGSLNKDTVTGWAFKPSMTTDGTDVYLAWSEQQALGQKQQGYAMKWSVGGGTWSDVGSVLNMDPRNGSLQRPVIGITASAAPVVTFSEVKLGSDRQIYARKIVSGSWSTISPSSTCAIDQTSLPNGTVNVFYSSGLSSTNCGSSTWTITSGALCAGLSLGSGTGLISGTPTTAQTCSFTVAYDTASQPLSITISAASGSVSSVKRFGNTSTFGRQP